MPAANPFAPVIEIGGGATAGPVSARGGAAVGVDDHHVSAGIVLFALIVLVLLKRAGFQFSAKAG